MIKPDKLFGQLGNRMFQMAYIFSQAKRGKIPDIYVQDPMHFEEYRNEIKQWFGQDIGKKISQVAVHVRRGDYVGNPFYKQLYYTKYYELAMDEFPHTEFLVFSDDIEWCKSAGMFERDGVFFYETTDPVSDMNAMAACEGHIIANSSFSWWAAYISPYSKKVICPDVKHSWYADNIARTFVPKEWQQIRV